MCGFAGVVVWDEKFRVSAETLKRMSARIAHRGPDGEGIYLSPPREITPEQPQIALAHRRLAILDPDPRSNQPFTDEAGRWMVFNGEIYNFRELRAELSRLRPEYQWRTSGDTEVLLVGYSVWGRDVVAYLNGMFAIAIWDAPNSQLFLARDRMGQKPLYVAKIDGRGEPTKLDDATRAPAAIAFASEVPALTEIPWFNKDIDHSALSEYLRWGYVPHPQTIYRGAAQLEPSYLLLLPRSDDVSRLIYSSTRYLPEARFRQPRRESDGIAVVHTREFVCQAVRRQLVSDVPLGCFLSGGIDSSVVAAAMKIAVGKDQQVLTFSVGFDDPRYDERHHAAEVARHLGTQHHEFCVRPDAANDLPKLAAAYGEPFGDSSALPTYYLSRATRGYLKVALSGDGGDELFGGYDRYRAMLLGRRLRMLTTPLPWKMLAPLARKFSTGHPKASATRAARFVKSLALRPSQRYQSYLRLFDEPLLQQLFTPSEPSFRVDFLNVLPFNPVRYAMKFDRMEYLPDDLLTKVDRASMAFGLEVRSPFMDHELVEFAANLRTNQLIDSRGGKRMLRDAFAADLPASVFNRKKMGFAVPIGDWFRGELRSMLPDSLTASNSFANANFNMPVVQRLIDDHESGRADHSQRLYALLMLELWWNTVRG